MSSNKSNTDNKSSNMQSGSGGIKQEPSKKAGSKKKGPTRRHVTPSYKTIKCWICKVEGQHSTRACPDRPKNIKKRLKEKAAAASAAKSATASAAASAAKSTAASAAKSATASAATSAAKSAAASAAKSATASAAKSATASAAASATASAAASATASTTASAAKIKPPTSIEKLIAENKCLYCGVQGHFIGNCPVKNWGKAPEAESASPERAGSSQGVKEEPLQNPPQATQPPTTPITTQAISTDAKSTDQQQPSVMPHIVAGSAVSLAQGCQPIKKKKRRGLKRYRGHIRDGVRMPKYKPALIRAEKLARQALAALEEDPLVVKREKTDPTETEKAATERPLLPPLTGVVKTEIVFEESQPTPTLVDIDSKPMPEQKRRVEILPSNHKPSPLSESHLPEPPPSSPVLKQTIQSKTMPKASEILPAYVRSKPVPVQQQSVQIDSRYPNTSFTFECNVPGQSSSSPALTHTKPKQILPKDQQGPPTCARLKPVPVPRILAQIRPKNPNPFAPPRMISEPPPSSPAHRQITPAQIGQKGPHNLPGHAPTNSAQHLSANPYSLTSFIHPRMMKGQPPSALAQKEIIPSSIGPKAPQQTAFKVPGSNQDSMQQIIQNRPTNQKPSALAPPHKLLGPTPSYPAQTQTIPAQIMTKPSSSDAIDQDSNPASVPLRTTQILSTNPNPSFASPPLLMSQKLPPLFPKPLLELQSTKLEAHETAWQTKRKKKRRGLKRNGGTRLGNGKRMPKYVPPSLRPKKLAERAAMEAEAALYMKRTRTDSMEMAQNTTLSSPIQAASKQDVPKEPQPPIFTAQSLVQDSPPSPAPTEVISKQSRSDDPQPSTPSPSSASIQSVFTNIVPKDPQPRKATEASRQIMPKDPQPALTHLAAVQDPTPSPEASSTQIPDSQSSQSRAPLRIFLGSTTSASALSAEPVPTNRQLSSLSSETGPPSLLSEPLLEPPSPPPEPRTPLLPSKKKKKKRNRGNTIDNDTWIHSYTPKTLIEKQAELAALKEEASKMGTTEAKPTPTQNTSKLDELNRQKQEIMKRQQAIREQKILYSKMLKAQLAMCTSGAIPTMPNVQYPGFPVSNAAPLRQPTVPITIVNHPNAAVKIPVPLEQRPVRILAPVNIVNEEVKEPPKSTQPAPSDVSMMHHFTTINHYPAGVPRSFLNPLYQEHLNQHKMEQMELKMQERELRKQQRKIEKIEMKLPQVADPSNGKESQVVLVEENSLGGEQPQAYSPSDVYGDMRNESGSAEPHEGSESPDPHGQKRLSAFKRLGPVTAPKKPKLTINLKCNTDQSVREVVDETETPVYTPVHLRHDVTTSTDETVMKYLFFWPWKKTVPIRRTASFKNSKSAMLLEQEQMEEAYDKDNAFIQITVTNYPRHWTKEQVFDVLLEQLNIIPCFIEFTAHECKFLVVRCKSALLAIHKMAFKLRKEELELHLSISVTLLSQNQIDFVPRLVLRRRLNMAYNGEGKLDLQEFTLKSDISHFIYFPLRMLSHQTDLIQLQSVVEWERLTELNLSRNRLTSIDGFHLNSMTPHLKKLDLSHNFLDKVTVLMGCRNLPLTSLHLEGNPLCHDYTDPAQYVKVVRMLFPAIRELDGVAIQLKGDLPTFNKNFCLYGAENIVEKFLETFYPLLEAQPADRLLIDEMYDENATLTVMYRYKFIHRKFRVSSSQSEFVWDGVRDSVSGSAVAAYLAKWPGLRHDPFTFTADTLFHSDTTTVIKICGILKLTSENLAEDEPVISFTRTTLLHTKDGVEYKILNELLLFDEPSNECHDSAFQVTKIRSKKLYVDLEFDSTPDEESKEKLIAIFGHLTELDRNASKRCLEKKEWNLRSALDNFIQLLKLNDLSSITSISNVPLQPTV